MIEDKVKLKEGFEKMEERSGWLFYVIGDGNFVCLSSMLILGWYMGE